MDLETLGVVYAVTKLDYFIRGAPNLAVYSDCSFLGPLFAKGIDEIKNVRLQRMREKTMGYAINVYHCPGTTHEIADFLLRNPAKSTEAPDFEIPPPFISSRSFCVLANSLDVKDPMLTRVVAAGLQDKDYSSMLRHLLNMTPLTDIPKDSKLFTMQGVIKSDSVELEEGSNNPFIVKDYSEVVIPKSMRIETLDKLHSTHLSYDGMTR